MNLLVKTHIKIHAVPPLTPRTPYKTETPTSKTRYNW